MWKLKVVFNVSLCVRETFHQTNIKLVASSKSTAVVVRVKNENAACVRGGRRFSVDANASLVGEEK